MTENLASASADFIASKPVANGASVVLEHVKDDGSFSYYQYSYRTSTGIDWPFYQERDFVQTGGQVLSDLRGKVTSIPDITFDENRLTFVLIRRYEGKFVTLNLDSTAPTMHEDVFLDAYAGPPLGAALQSLNSMLVFEDEGSTAVKKLLTRGKDGIWLYDGKPYTKRVISHSLKVPLPKLSERMRQASARATKNDASASTQDSGLPTRAAPGKQGQKPVAVPPAPSASWAWLPYFLSATALALGALVWWLRRK